VKVSEDFLNFEISYFTRAVVSLLQVLVCEQTNSMMC